MEVLPDAQGDLAGTYVKFTTGPHPTSAAYAVVWLKVSVPKRLIVGVAVDIMDTAADRRKLDVVP